MPLLRKHAIPFLCILLCVFFYFFIAFKLNRGDFYSLLTVYSSLCLFSYILYKTQQHRFWFLVGLAIIFRLIFIFSMPTLSQDFYRFIWDGRMLLEGFNPYISLPETFINNHEFPIAQAKELYEGMGEMNGSHYTNYPPINQLCFFIAALFSKESILGSAIVFRVLIILADIGIFYFGKKILNLLHLPVSNIFFYFLNPFIIIELTGNLHFESVMLFFLVWSIYALLKRKWLFSAVLLGVSISVKLIPLLFLPLFIQWFTKEQNCLRWKKGKFQYILFGSITLVTVILLFAPFYTSSLIDSYTNSVGLWFKNFEFNASIYFILREIGYLFRGYNEIAILGKTGPLLTVVLLIILAFFRDNTSPKKLITAMLFGLSFYYFTTTTMHPWYLATLLILSVFTDYRYPLVWSFVMILSYSAYINDGFKENYYFITLEYILVYGVLLWELFAKKSKAVISESNR